MRRLIKTDVPEVLIENGSTWTSDLLNAIARCAPTTEIRSLQGRYAHPDIKTAIVQETQGKCAYCESAMRHISPGHIEHILPKSRVPSACFDWNNLTLACPECNRHKRDYYDAAQPLLNPYIDDPEQELAAHGPWLRHLPSRYIAMRTIQRLELNRAELQERRLERIEQVGYLADAWCSQPPGPTREALLTQLKIEVGEDKEYSFAVKSALRLWGVPV